MDGVQKLVHFQKKNQKAFKNGNQKIAQNGVVWVQNVSKNQ